MNTITNHEGPYITYDISDTNLDEVNRNGQAYNSNWLYQQTAEGKITEIEMNEILAMADILQNLFPELWDIQVAKCEYKYKLQIENLGYGLRTFEEDRKINKLYFKIIIRFPNFTITNSSNLSHRITDLYVQTKYMPDILDSYSNNEGEDERYLPDVAHNLEIHNGFWVRFNKLRLRELQGLRGSLSIFEYNSSYLHSHISGFNNYFPHWKAFCLGSGEIVPTMGLIYQDFTPEIFNLFVLQINAYVRWESIEGRPYKYIKDIKITKDLLRLPPVSSNISQNHLGNILAQINDSRQRRVIDPNNEFNRIVWERERNRIWNLWTDENILDENWSDYIHVENGEEDGYNDDYDYFFDWNDEGMDHYIIMDNPEFRHPLLNWKLSNGLMELIDDENFESFIKYSDDPSVYYSNTVFYQDLQGKYYSIEYNNAISIPRVLSTVTFLFKGEDKSLQITIPEREPLKPDFIIHPDIKKYIKTKLENYANYNRIKSNISSRANQIANTQRST